MTSSSNLSDFNRIDFDRSMMQSFTLDSSLQSRPENIYFDSLNFSQPNCLNQSFATKESLLQNQEQFLFTNRSSIEPQTMNPFIFDHNNNLISNGFFNPENHFDSPTSLWSSPQSTRWTSSSSESSPITSMNLKIKEILNSLDINNEFDSNQFEQLDPSFYYDCQSIDSSVGKNQRKIMARSSEYYKRFGWDCVEISTKSISNVISFLESSKFYQNDSELLKKSNADSKHECSIKEGITNSNSSSVIGSDCCVSYQNLEALSNLKYAQCQSNASSIGGKKMYCAFCKNLPKERSNYQTHWLKDNEKRVTCPILRAFNCPLCNNNGGDNAHTIRFCPVKRQRLAFEYQRTWP
ncbi:Nanos -like protein 1 [Sarcoptes scabiei]|uniref:Nanos -like protein 1 n=1 Tax=Sarcoptes scabiei TaxID=52283 RepID=A0A834RE32_SARSC|nr:Nanos -like protein 1 [Sarcoptes scabiei]